MKTDLESWLEAVAAFSKPYVLAGMAPEEAIKRGMADYTETLQRLATDPALRAAATTHIAGQIWHRVRGEK